MAGCPVVLLSSCRVVKLSRDRVQLLEKQDNGGEGQQEYYLRTLPGRKKAAGFSDCKSYDRTSTFQMSRNGGTENRYDPVRV
jgi:hypothetical protein